MRVPPRRPDHPNVYWHGDDNVGDVMAAWIATQISGKTTRFTHHTWREDKVFVTGSIMSLADETTTVWGAGIAWRNDPISPLCKILAVRGPLTRERAIACGAKCPEIYGDPALLMSWLYEPQPLERRPLGIVPHLVDYDSVMRLYGHDESLRIVDVRHSPESVANAIAGCDAIVSSSLHGLIIAHAYRVPIGWVKFSNRVIGDDVKFHDFYRSLGVQPPAYLGADVTDALIGTAQPAPVSKLRDCVRDDLPTLNTEPLYLACPFRNTI